MTKVRQAKILSEEDIDSIVEAQAHDDAAWEEPVHVRKRKPASVRLPSELVERAGFFAHLHRKSNVEDWLATIIQERMDLEESVFTGLKRDLAVKRRV